MVKLPRFMIAGTNSGVGKTTVTLGVMSALAQKGMKVQGFKAGPDYIDPSHHTFVTGNASRNLDTWIMGDGVCCELFERSAAKADVSVIEGVMGLYDGSIDGTGVGSSAHLAKILKTPVVLVINAKGVAQSAGAVVLGYKEFDKEVPLSGIIVNNIAGDTHYDCIKRAIEERCSVPVLGYIKSDNEITIPERHLGLIPFTEGKSAHTLYGKLGEMVLDTVDVERLLTIANSALPFRNYHETLYHDSGESINVHLALARDEAFCFYYHDDIELLESLGARITYFSPLHDRSLPDRVDGVYLGGGFPELYAGVLMKNRSMRDSIVEASKKGIQLYGECGGLIYLLEKLIDTEGRAFTMCGVVKGSCKMEKRRQGLGYVTVHAQSDNLLCNRGDTFRAHEFHWSRLVDVPQATVFAYETRKSNGKRQGTDGIGEKNIFVSYTHVHFSSNRRLAINLLTSMAKKTGS